MTNDHYNDNIVQLEQFQPVLHTIFGLFRIVHALLDNQPILKLRKKVIFNQFHKRSLVIYLQLNWYGLLVRQVSLLVLKHRSLEQRFESPVNVLELLEMFTLTSLLQNFISRKFTFFIHIIIYLLHVFLVLYSNNLEIVKINLLVNSF